MSSERHRKIFCAASLPISSLPSFHARCLSSSSITFLLLAILATQLVPLTLAHNVASDCVIHRPPTAKGNYTPIADIVKRFNKVKLQCDRANAGRRDKSSGVLNRGTYTHKIPTVKFGVQLATEGRDAIGQMLPAIDVAIEKITSMEEFRGVYVHVVPILYYDWLACDSLAILEKFNQKEVNVIFGPLNDFVLGSAARFSTALYLIPIVSPAASAVNLADKNEFGMLTRMYFTYADLKWVIQSTLEQFGWLPNVSTPVSLITVYPVSFEDSYNAGWDALFQRQAVSETLTAYKAHSHDIKRGDTNLHGALEEVKNNSRSKSSY